MFALNRVYYNINKISQTEKKLLKEFIKIKKSFMRVLHNIIDQELSLEGLGNTLKALMENTNNTNIMSPKIKGSIITPRYKMRLAFITWSLYSFYFLK